MTTHNRDKQTLFTLKSFTQSSFKNIHVIIVDDSDTPLLREKLVFPFKITYIYVTHKTWLNSCINFNIGFREVTTERMIIQNGEVYHKGDVISYVNTHYNPLEYLVFDTFAIKNESHNENIAIKPDAKNGMWYQHYSKNPVRYHFLCAGPISLAMMGMSYEYADGYCYDDNDFVFKIDTELRLRSKFVKSDETFILGMHQKHKTTVVTIDACKANASYFINKLKEYASTHADGVELLKLHKSVS